MDLIATTERLRIVKFTTEDAPFILELVNTPAWLQYIGDREIHTLEDAAAYILNGPIKSYRKLGFGAYCLEEIATGKKIGSCGLYKREGLTHPDLGFALLPEFEAKGYAFEASRKLLQIAAGDFGIETLTAITSKGNERSVQLLKKLGFEWTRFIKLPNDQEELNLFLLTLQS